MNAKIDAMKAEAAKHSTKMLLDGLDIIEAMPHLDPAQRLTKAVISDVITERHGIDDELDEIYMDDDYVDSYTDAIKIALARKGVL